MTRDRIGGWMLAALAAGALALLSGCASAPELKPDRRPIVRGEPGEPVRHLLARMIARFCVGDETEHVVAQIADRLADCAEDRQEDCELKVCDRLRKDAPRRCTPGLALNLD